MAHNDVELWLLERKKYLLFIGMSAMILGGEINYFHHFCERYLHFLNACLLHSQEGYDLILMFLLNI